MGFTGFALGTIGGGVMGDLGVQGGWQILGGAISGAASSAAMTEMSGGGSLGKNILEGAFSGAAGAAVGYALQEARVSVASADSRGGGAVAAGSGGQGPSGNPYQLVCNSCSDEEPAPLGVREAFQHYREGSGLTLKAPFSQLDVDVGAEYFKGFRTALAGAEPGNSYAINTVAPFATKGYEAAIFGHVTLRLQGELSVGMGGWWSFDGRISALNDIYDFNPSTHRTLMGEASTWVGSQFKGKPYEIQFIGSKPVYNNGVLPQQYY